MNTRIGWAGRGITVMLLMVTTTCGDRPPGAGVPPAAETEPTAVYVTVFFSRGEEAVGVRRLVEEAPDVPALESALRELLRGPTPEERGQGFSSWFSQETAHAVHGVDIDDEGNAVVDFRDLTSLIPAASSSAGSTMLLAELNSTVFHHPAIRSVEYRMDGSCDGFWNWLQYDCRILTREEAGYTAGRLREAGHPAAAVTGATRDPSPTAHLSWEPQESGLTSSLRGLSAVDGSTAWISGTGGHYAFTQDGGASWSPGSVPGAESLDFRDVEAFPGGVAYLMSAGPGASSRIYKTTDWGTTWTLQYANELEDAFFNGFAFWDPESGALVGDPLDGRMFLLLTVDGGQTWERPAPDRAPAFEPGEYGFAASGTSIATLGDSGLAIASGGSAARVFLSRDRGGSWEVIATPITAGSPSSGIFSIAFRSPLEALAVGGNYQEDNLTGGNIALSRDGGRSWSLAPEPHDVGYRSGVAWREDPRHPMWMAVGTSGSSYSVDGGRRWETFDTAAFNAVAFAGSVGWAAGPGGRVARLVVKD
jgi:photosystem II stability/assembly factor-like uncharacterized protein